jgi:hypothetical protein
MSVDHRFWPAVVLATLLSIPAHADDWVVSQAGGSVIEMPGFMDGGIVRILQANGEAYGVSYEPTQPISLRQYRTQTRARPFAYLKSVIALAEVNYSVDEVGRGVVSGNLSRELGFYATCRREPGELVCIEMYYHADLQSDFASMIGRIARSFSRTASP